MTETKLRIGVDGNEANLVDRVGVNTYAYETLKAISQIEDEWNKSLQFEIVLKEEPKEHMPPESDNFKYLVLPGSGLWILKSLTPFLLKNKNRYHVFWTPSHYVPPLSFTPRVCSIMDLGYLKFASQFRKYDYWQLKLWTILSLVVSKKIIAISETTKKDIRSHYWFTKNKVVTTLLGYDEKRFNEKIKVSQILSIKKKFGIEGEYVLFLSVLKPSKNVDGLLRAWKMVHTQFPGTKLVISGRKGWLYESVFELTKELKIEKSVIFTGFFEESEKPALIAGAKIFVLPSFWEGFGLDVVSAMACGIPVIVSNRGSLPEVVEEAGVIIDPNDPEDIAAAISRILTMSKSEYTTLSRQGLLRAKHFSWESTARQTINILKVSANDASTSKI